MHAVIFSQSLFLFLEWYILFHVCSLFQCFSFLSFSALPDRRRQGQYWHREANECKMCAQVDLNPRGLACDKEGVLLETLPISAGYWRAMDTSTVNIAHVELARKSLFYSSFLFFSADVSLFCFVSFCFAFSFCKKECKRHAMPFNLCDERKFFQSAKRRTKALSKISSKMKTSWVDGR